MGEYVNSKQVQFNKSYASCAIVEVHHLPKQPATKTLFAIANHLYNKANPRPGAFILFSDVVPEDGTHSNGQALAEAIRRTNAVGILSESRKEVNPRTGNVVQVWLLHLSHDNFRKWYQDQLANMLDVD